MEKLSLVPPNLNSFLCAYELETLHYGSPYQIIEANNRYSQHYTCDSNYTPYLNGAAVVYGTTEFFHINTMCVHTKVSKEKKNGLNCQIVHNRDFGLAVIDGLLTSVGGCDHVVVVVGGWSSKLFHSETDQTHSV